jgi:hypothetical protein
LDVSTERRRQRVESGLHPAAAGVDTIIVVSPASVGAAGPDRQQRAGAADVRHGRARRVLSTVRRVLMLNTTTTIMMPFELVLSWKHVALIPFL